MEIVFCTKIPHGKFKGRFITEDGDILSNKNGTTFLSKKVTASGFLIVQGRDEGKKVSEYVHLLTANTFVPNENDYKYVEHVDGNVKNNHKDNLVWKEFLDESFEYKTVPGFSRYKISKTSVLRKYNKNSYRLMKSRLDEGGYVIYSLTGDDNLKRVISAHRLVALTYIPNPLNLPEVDHIDRKRDNNNLENLRWADRQIQSSNKKLRDTSKISKPVKQYTLSGDFVEIHLNLYCALRSLGLSAKARQAIKKCINKNRGKNMCDKNEFKYASYGFIWMSTESYTLQKGEKAVPIVGKYNKKFLNFPVHQITNFGNVIGTDGMLMPLNMIDTCPAVTLQHKKVKMTFQVHVLVATFFVEGKTKKRNQVNHLDENRTNSRYDNLEWTTPSENINYSAYKCYKSVTKMDINNKELEIYESITSAATDINPGNVSAAKTRISLCCKGLQKTSYGFKWKYTKK